MKTSFTHLQVLLQFKIAKRSLEIERKRDIDSKIRDKVTTKITTQITAEITAQRTNKRTDKGTAERINKREAQIRVQVGDQCPV